MSRSTRDVSERSAVVGDRVRSLAGAAAAAVPKSWTHSVRLTASLTALAGLGSLTATRIALNAPVVLPSVASSTWYDAVTLAAIVGPAAGILLLGVTTAEAWTRAGLVLASVFGLLSAVTSAVAVPAVGATVVGGWLMLRGALATLPPANRRRIRVVVFVLLTGLTLSLFGAVGVHPVALRTAGTTLALAGMAVTPLAVRPRTSAFAVGGVAAATTFYLTGAAPFVSGAVVLIAGSVVGGSALLLAAAVGGLTATVVEGAASGRVTLTSTGLLLLMAGVPSSIPRALGVTLAVAFILATRSDQDGDST
ncbi:phosphate ABC transporter permease [Haladaptatus sp. NG-WS-4]